MTHPSISTAHPPLYFMTSPIPTPLTILKLLLPLNFSENIVENCWRICTFVISFVTPKAVETKHEQKAPLFYVHEETVFILGLGRRIISFITGVEEFSLFFRIRFFRVLCLGTFARLDTNCGVLIVRFILCDELLVRFTLGNNLIIAALVVSGARLSSSLLCPLTLPCLIVFTSLHN